MKRFSLLFICVSLIAVSCRKEDDKLDSILQQSINSNDEFGLTIGQIEMGTGYEVQSYYDLGTKSMVSSNLKTEWDLAFSCNLDGHILLNSAKSDLRVAKFDGDWSDPIIIEDLAFLYDLSDGNIENMAIGQDFSTVYILNRGLDLDLEEIGFVKLQFSQMEDAYEVIVAELDGSNEQSFIVDIDPNYNYRYLNLDTGLKTIEPMKGEYDLHFTHYLYVYDPETEPFPYMVTGVLSNPNGVEVAEIFDLPFEEIEYNDALAYEFSDQRDVIGFDWKFFDFEDGFVTDPSLNYVIRSTEGDLFKLHFTSFYNDSFEKGYPQFELQKLRQD